MKLQEILEGLKSAGTPIRDTANVLGHLIELYYTNDKYTKTKPAAMFKSFIKKPLPNTWAAIKNDFVASTIEIINSSQELKELYGDMLPDITELLSMSDSVVVSSLLDVDPNHLNHTPLRPLALGKSHRDKMKLAFQPAGIVSIGSGIGNLKPEQLKPLIKQLADSGKYVQKDVSGLFPGPIEKNF
jgi:hypothetical protein